MSARSISRPCGGRGWRGMRTDRRGFTLLETVISLTILAAIAGIIAVAFRLVSVSLERGEEEVRSMARLRAGIDILERTIRSANPAPIPTGDGSSLYFLGEAKKIRFLTTFPASSRRGFRRVCFFGTEGPDGGGISLADASPFRKGTDSWEV